MRFAATFPYFVALKQEREVPMSHSSDATAPEAAGRFSINEDWLAVVVGLTLLTLILTGLIPQGLIP